MISTGTRRALEEPPGGVRVGGRDPQAGEVVDDLVRRVVGHGRGEAAAAVAQRPDPRQLGAGLAQQVVAGDAEVGHAVADELDDVVGAHEQDVEVVVLDERDQAPVVLLEDEAGIVQEAKRRLDQASLVRDRQPQARSHRSPVTGYGRLPERDAAWSLSSIAR